MAKPKLPEQLGQVARAARTARGMTQEDVAELIGVSTEFYARLERGQALPSVTTLVKLAPAIAVCADALLGLAEPKPNAATNDDPPALRRLLQKLRAAPPAVVAAVDVLISARRRR